MFESSLREKEIKREKNGVLCTLFVHEIANADPWGRSVRGRRDFTRFLWGFASSPVHGIAGEVPECS